MSPERLRVALVGAGVWGRIHARAFAARPDVELVAVAGRSEERTRTRALEYGMRPYTNISEMLDAERPDLVSVSLPNQSHFAPTLEVIRAGYPLLVEKPLTFELDEADTLLSEAAARGLFFAINFNHRCAKPMQLARQATDEGRLGEIVYATWRFGGEGASDHPHANLIETQCHTFDSLEYLCGPVASVTAQMTDKTGGGFRTVALALEFSSGAVGTLLGTYDASYAHPDTQRLEVGGTAGRLVIHDTVRRYEFHPNGSELGEVWEAGYFNDPDRDFLHTMDVSLDGVLDALRRGTEPPVHARAGRRALELAHAAIASFETGRRVETHPVQTSVPEVAR